MTKKKTIFSQEVIVAIVLVALYLIFRTISSDFGKYTTFLSMMDISYYYVLMAIGVAFPLITGGVDLSIGTGMICYALAGGFESIYSVDPASGHYLRFCAHGSDEDLQVDETGEDFFGETAKKVEDLVYQPDRERVRLSLTKEVLMTPLAAGHSFSLTFRMLSGERPAYHTLVAVGAPEGSEHSMVIGLSNVDEQVQQVIAGELRREENGGT